MKDSGVIYEDPYVQVGCSLISEFLGNLMKLTFKLHSVQKTYPLLL